MLTSFTIKNFMSILDATLHFSFAEGKAPNGYKKSVELIFCEPTKKQRIVPVMAIYGANASGKTNIIKAMHAFKQIALGNIFGLYSPNRLIKPNDPMTLSCGFCAKKRSYVYSVTINKTGILEEVLTCDSLEVFRIADGKCFFSHMTSSQVYTEEKLLEIFQVECTNESSVQIRTFLSRLGTHYQKLNAAAFEAYFYLSNIEIYPQNRFPMSFGIERMQNLNKDTFENSLADVAKLLKKLDIGIEGLSVDQKQFENILEFIREQPFTHADSILQKPQSPVIVANVIRSYHKDINGDLVEFIFNEDESDGTKVLAGLLGVFLFVLKRGDVLVIDELDKAMHPYIFEKIVSMFKDRDYNQNNAQLIFTAHDTDLLDTGAVRKSEVAIVDKTLKGGTSIHRIAEFSGIRNVTNFRRQYMLGTFGGIPHPYI